MWDYTGASEQGGNLPRNILIIGSRFMKRRVIAIGAVIIAVIILSVGLYIGIFDARKAVRHIPVEIDLEAVGLGISEMNGTSNDDRIFLYDVAGDRAVIAVNTAIATGNLSETYSEYIQLGQYQYEKLNTTPESEILLQKWNYTPIFKRIMSTLGLQNKDLGNPFAAIYGEEKAKNMPNYPYYIRIIIEADKTRYVIDAFCNNPGFLNQVIAEVANQY